MIMRRMSGAVNNGKSITDHDQEKENRNHQSEKHRIVRQREKAMPVLRKIYGEMNDK